MTDRLNPTPFPATCHSNVCDKPLCDGCEHRENFRAYWAASGAAASFERSQYALRQMKHKGVGPFAPKPGEQP